MQPTGGAPLYETLEATFPRGLMPEGLEVRMKYKVRRRLRDVGYRVLFPDDEPWEDIMECFAIASLERLHRSYGEHPWFWIVAWPAVLGAAAADFFEQAGTAAERRAVACTATAAHLEALLVSRALHSADSVDDLPAPAVLGLRAISQSTLPALPAKALSGLASSMPSLTQEPAASGGWQPPPLPGMSLLQSSPTAPLPATAVAHAVTAVSDEMVLPAGASACAGIDSSASEAAQSTSANPVSSNAEDCDGYVTRLGNDELPAEPMAASSALTSLNSFKAEDFDEDVTRPGNEKLPAAACEKDVTRPVDDERRVAAACGECRRDMVRLKDAPEAYNGSCVFCNVCCKPCGPDSPQKHGAVFWHCSGCQYDLCSPCALPQNPGVSPSLGGS